MTGVPDKAAETGYETELACTTTLVTGVLTAKRKQYRTRLPRFVDAFNEQFVHRLQEESAGKSAGRLPMTAIQPSGHGGAG